ncbi:MAG: DUF1559 domain-containing protein [Gemmataceae bacterium]
MGMAAHTYADTNGALPAGGTFTDDGRMLHGWAVHLLPYLIYDIRTIDLQRPWIDPVNAKAFRSVLPEFVNPDLRHPALYDAQGFALSHYAANSHVLAANRRMKLDEITDGTSVTLLIGEVNAGFKAWGHPLNGRDPAKGINHSPQGFGGRHGVGRRPFRDGRRVGAVRERASQPRGAEGTGHPRGDEPIDKAAPGGNANRPCDDELHPGLTPWAIDCRPFGAWDRLRSV